MVEHVLVRAVLDEFRRLNFYLLEIHSNTCLQFFNCVHLCSIVFNYTQTGFRMNSEVVGLPRTAEESFPGLIPLTV